MTSAHTHDPNKGVTDACGIAQQTSKQFDLHHSKITVQPASVGYTARIEHDKRPTEYGLLAEGTVDALRRVSGGEAR